MTFGTKTSVVTHCYACLSKGFMSVTIRSPVFFVPGVTKFKFYFSLQQNVITAAVGT